MYFTNAPPLQRKQVVTASRFRMPLLLWGLFLLFAGCGLYLTGILLSVFRVCLALGPRVQQWNEAIVWYSGVPITLGLVLCAIDLGLILPHKRRIPRWVEGEHDALKSALITVALTAYNDEESIGPTVRDFRAHPRVHRVLVVSNNSVDGTMDQANAAGALVVNESKPGYGNCVYRCLQEALKHVDSDLIALCEGDRTFRARDVDKFLAYLPHAELVNGTRIVEQLRSYDTQLSTFMYYGNFFVGKLLEVRHLGRGTFTDVGTTYKVFRREALMRLMPLLNPNINLEFNAHLMDTALEAGIMTVECPITFHSRVGRSKGGNVNNLRALKVGLRMIWGITFGWPGISR